MAEQVTRGDIILRYIFICYVFFLFSGWLFGVRFFFFWALGWKARLDYAFESSSRIFLHEHVL